LKTTIVLFGHYRVRAEFSQRSTAASKALSMFWMSYKGIFCHKHYDVAILYHHTA